MDITWRLIVNDFATADRESEKNLTRARLHYEQVVASHTGAPGLAQEEQAATVAALLALRDAAVDRRLVHQWQQAKLWRALRELARTIEDGERTIWKFDRLRQRLERQPGGGDPTGGTGEGVPGGGF